jgi:hypothetical protein
MPRTCHNSPFYISFIYCVLCYRKNMGWGCVRAGCRGRYLGLRKRE